MEYDSSNIIIRAAEVTKRVDEIRRQLDLNQEQFAALLNISQPAVSKYLRERIPPAEILLRLARRAGTTIEWILTGEKNYFFTESTARVHDNEQNYQADSDFMLARKIALLPADVRQSLIRMIDYLQKGGQK